MTAFSIVLGLIYFVVGAAKLAGAKPLAEQFDEFGLSNNAMRAVGAAEVAAAIGLQIDGLDVFAAAGMMAMMVGAIVHHRRAGHPIQAMMPSVVVLVASGVFVALSI